MPTKSETSYEHPDLRGLTSRIQRLLDAYPRFKQMGNSRTDGYLQAVKWFHNFTANLRGMYIECLKSFGSHGDKGTYTISSLQQVTCGEILSVGRLGNTSDEFVFDLFYS